MVAMHARALLLLLLLLWLFQGDGESMLLLLLPMDPAGDRAVARFFKAYDFFANNCFHKEVVSSIPISVT